MWKENWRKRKRFKRKGEHNSEAQKEMLANFNRLFNAREDAFQLFNDYRLDAHTQVFCPKKYFVSDVMACRTSGVEWHHLFFYASLLNPSGSKALNPFLTISTTGCTFQYLLMLFIDSSPLAAARLAWMNMNQDRVMVSLMIGTRYLDCHYILNLGNFKLPVMILIPRNFFISSFVTSLALPVLVIKRMLVFPANNPHNSSVNNFWSSSNGLLVFSER